MSVDSNSIQKGHLGGFHEGRPSFSVWLQFEGLILLASILWLDVYSKRDDL